MLLYHSTKTQFLSDVTKDNIEDILQDKFLEILGKNIARNEYISWQNSLKEMFLIISISTLPDDANISIEYSIPGSSKRIDFIVTGTDSEGKDIIVIVELKQWQKAELTKKDGVVITRFEHGSKPTSHPSYQAWSYAMLLKGFNEVVYTEDIQLKPCAYLHNYKDDGVITNAFYKSYTDVAPAFLKGDKQKLADFLSQNIVGGDITHIMNRVDESPMRPSKALADSMVSMIKGNDEFVMIDEQKVVYETAVELAKKAKTGKKQVLIVEGGPGTGKSVVAVNLLVGLNKLGLMAQYVTKNAAPRAVYQSKLTGEIKKTEISNLFTGSGSFTESAPNEFDVLIVDEAHRLNEKSGMFSNLGENQIKEIIHASHLSVFFIDEDQKVTFKDIGEKAEIEEWAKLADAEVSFMELTSQFRCNGSDGYLAWIDNALQIRETANVKLGEDYEFRIIDTPNELRDIIFEKNKINNKARLVAGYCWDWASRGNPSAYDIVFPEYQFGMKWNLATDGNLWILAPESVKEIGCIHTCQGLEMDYVGVIVGNDILVRNGEVLVDPTKRASTDASIKGYKKLLKDNPVEAKEKIKAIIKNTYRTLMTRGMKGCYVYFSDEETKEYFKNIL